ncbi:MAG: phosphodiester glycosidase family protein [Phycisphaerae bacterium]|jgi:hypothetical protein
MKAARSHVLATVWLLGRAATAGAATDVAPGVTYELHAAPGPNRVHVVAVERLRSEYKLEVGWPGRKRNFTALARTSAIAAAYDLPPGHDVLAATNGSFFGTVPDVVGAPIASAGEMLQRPNTGNDTFYFGPSRAPGVQSEIQHVNGTLTFANGASIPLQRYNSPADSLNATAFTPQWDSSTRSSGGYVEVILSDVTYPMRSEKEVSGIVTAVKTGSASANNAIPAGGMVIYGGLDAYGPILNNTAVGDRWRMRFATSAAALNNADFAVTGIGWVVREGAANAANWAQRSSAGPYARHPRTVLAASDTHLFLVVCDGRSAASVGMTFQEMADFLIGTLGVREAVNLDGGGSSTMVVNGGVMNAPSDGSERSVANAVMLVKQSTATAFPVSDPFGPAGRLPGWDDKFAYSPVVPFAPAAPGGDGYVLKVGGAVGGVQTVRRGDFSDADYTVAADVYCDYRPDAAGDGSELSGLFARDSGTGALALATYGGGNCYAMLYDSATGAIRAGRFVNGAFTHLLPAGSVTISASGWHRFRIDCYGGEIRFKLDGAQLVRAADATFARGFFGVGYQELFNNNANARGARVDHFTAFVDPFKGGVRGDFDDDGDVDLEDFGRLQACLLGTGVEQTAPECAVARLDGDPDVDSADLNLFLSCFRGPNVPAPAACGGTAP